jgi:hypothetical protein
MPPEKLDLWHNLSHTVDTAETSVVVGIVGKYTGLSDSYLSVVCCATPCDAHFVLCLSAYTNFTIIVQCNTTDEGAFPRRHSVRSSPRHRMDRKRIPRGGRIGVAPDRVSNVRSLASLSALQ